MVREVTVLEAVLAAAATALLGTLPLPAAGVLVIGWDGSLLVLCLFLVLGACLPLALNLFIASSTH